MIRARHNLAYTAFFRFYTRWKLKRHFHHLSEELELPDGKKPLLLIANHFSWWDGFICFYLNDLYFKKKFHVMMLEEELGKRMFLHRAGAFSIRKSTRSVVESVRYSSSVLSSPGNLLLMYPQGQFQSQYEHDLRFEKGIEKILNGCSADPEILFNVNLVEYFQHPSPTLYIRTRIYTGERTTAAMEAAFREFRASCISCQKKKIP